MKDIKKDILWRVYLIYFVVLAIAIGIISRAAFIQFALREDLMEKAKKQEIRYFPIEALRGNIFARDGSLLASSIPIFEVRMDLSSEVVSDIHFQSAIDSLSLMLSQLFRDKDVRTYKAGLQKARKEGNRYFLVKNNVRYEELKKLKEFPIFRLGRFRGGLIIIRKTTRELPYKELARRTIGFENAAETIYVGLEGAYTDVLSGEGGLQLKRRISNGDWIPLGDRPEVEPRDGMDIITTIDINIQDLAQTSLALHMHEHQAYQGCAILMEVKTGEIRAITNLRYDPSDGKYKELYNYSVGESVEPGSTFKLASVVAALETGKVKLNDYYFVGNGSVKYHSRVMKDVHRPDSSYLTIREIFEESSNVGISQIITSLFSSRPEAFVESLRKMSLGEPLGIEIPGEGKPILKDPKDKRHWYGTTLPWMSIGYELTMTPLQILTFFNAIANDGIMVKPMFVNEIREGGKTVEKFEPVVINPSICSKTTLDAVRSLLEGVVTHGTGKILKDTIYKIAGKTGTALVADANRGYAQKHYNASFAGYFPADNPKYSCIIVVNRPQSGKIYGGAVAAPVFKEIANKVYATQLDIHDLKDRKTKPSVIPQTPATGYYEDIRNSLASLSYPAVQPKKAADWISLDSSKYALIMKPIDFSPDTVPDLTGMTAKDAIFLLEKAGLTPTIKGKGLVFSQSLPAGTPLIPGTDVMLTLENPKR
ncbi:MAG: transpeptidase family protein [Bacteroidales bacterium]|nr:transpeptidase family protein [Bacteroidales bacterium]